MCCVGSEGGGGGWTGGVGWGGWKLWFAVGVQQMGTNRLPCPPCELQARATAPPVWPPPRRGTHVRGEVLPAKPICATPASARFCRSPLAEAAAPTLVDTAASGVDLEVDVTDDAASRVCEKLRGRAPSEGLSLQGHMAC